MRDDSPLQNLGDSDAGPMMVRRAEADGALGPAELRELSASLERVRRYAEQARAASTRSAYEKDWRQFESWCSRFGREALPAEPSTVVAYVGDISERLKLSTIERRLASISVHHKDAGFASPASVSEGPLRLLWPGLVREKTRRQKKAEPLLRADLRNIVQQLPRDEKTGELTLAALRDRALLLVGWAGALRRSEIVSLEVEDLRFDQGEGVTLYIRRSKTDQAGEGLVKGIAYGQDADTCPVVALRMWLRAAGIADGPVFRRLYRNGAVGKAGLSGQVVSLILKQHGQRVGLEAEEFSAHSLRRGFITQAIRMGKDARRVKEHSGHKSWDVFNGYVKESAVFQENPTRGML